MVQFSTPRHLQNAADKELDKILKAGVLEPVEHLTDWCNCGFFMQKNTHSGHEAKARLVIDLRGLNKVLKRVSNGSSHIFKQLNPVDKYSHK